MTEDRQLKVKALEFKNRNIEDKYKISKPLNTIEDFIGLITKIIVDSYDEVKDKYDIEKIKEFKLFVSQRIDNKPPHIDIVMELWTWETKNEMYNRRSYEKRELEKKVDKLKRESLLVGYKLEKIDD